jgi:hypothetical protein
MVTPARKRWRFLYGRTRANSYFSDVVYEDALQRSNRRVLAEVLGGQPNTYLRGVSLSRKIEKIAEKSGCLPLPKKTLAVRAPIPTGPATSLRLRP